MLLTVREAAERLHVSPRTVEREIAAGRLACCASVRHREQDRLSMTRIAVPAGQ